MTGHLTMEQLVAARDGDRSDPSLAAAHRHLADCPACQGELDRLHQRTARLRALATMAPGRDHFPDVRSHLQSAAAHRRQRTLATIGLAIAAIFLIAVVGRNLLQPPTLDAEQQLETAMTDSQLLEQQLREWRPDARVLDAQTAVVVIQLEDRIAALDAELARVATHRAEERRDPELALWQKRVGLMNALVDVHVTKASNVGL